LWHPGFAAGSPAADREGPVDHLQGEITMSRANTQALAAACLLLPPFYERRFDRQEYSHYSALRISPEALPRWVQPVEADFYVQGSEAGFNAKGETHTACVSHIRNALGGYDYVLALPGGQPIRVMHIHGHHYTQWRFNLRDNNLCFDRDESPIKVAVLATLMRQFILDVLPHFDEFVQKPGA
jgi:hypothetical protein